MWAITYEIAPNDQMEICMILWHQKIRMSHHWFFNVTSLFAFTMVISKIMPTPNDDMINHFKITLLVYWIFAMDSWSLKLLRSYLISWCFIMECSNGQEHVSLLQNDTWESAMSLPKGKKVICYKWIYKFKHNLEYGSIEWHNFHI